MNLREKLKKQPILGTITTLSDPVSAEILGYAGYDFVWVDTEHAAKDYSALYAQLTALKMTGTAAFVRVTIDDKNHVKHVLENGVDGIIFPMINTAKQAKDAMDSCLYPPLGTRGFGPLRAVRYGLDNAHEYTARYERDLIRCIQIETVEAVENLPEILKVPYIDGVVLGLRDLSTSVGDPGNIFGEKTLAFSDRVAKAVREAGLFLGVSTYSTDPKDYKFWKDRYGIAFYSCGVDHEYILHGAIKNLENLKKI